MSNTTQDGAELVSISRDEYLRDLKSRVDFDRIFPVLPQHNLFVHRFTPCNAKRFVSLFQATWHKIPLWARRRILAWWRDGPIPTMVPNVELSIRKWMGGAAGQCGLAGGQLKFSGRIIDRTPDGLACGLIAHELAHVLQWASGWMTPGRPKYDKEDEVESLVAQWGFESYLHWFLFPEDIRRRRFA